MSIAVIVLNWNGAQDTLDCVASLTDEPEIVLIVDNGSSDVESLCRRLPKSCSLVESEKNLGFAGGCNLGARKACESGAEILLFLNNDARLGTGCIGRLKEALDSGWTAVNPVIHSGLPEEDQPTLWYEKGKISLGDFIVADHVEATPEDRAREIYESDLVTGCALMIRADDFFAAGGFDEGLFAYFEDVDLSLKLKQKGGKLGVVRGARAWHRGSASSGGYASPLSLFYLFRNGPILTERHASPEQKRRYKKKAPLQCLAAAANFSHRSLRSGAAALYGAWAGRTGHRGVAPEPLAPPWLIPLAWLNFTAWRLLRPLFRRTPPKGTPAPERAA